MIRATFERWMGIVSDTVHRLIPKEQFPDAIYDLQWDGYPDHRPDVVTFALSLGVEECWTRVEWTHQPGEAEFADRIASECSALLETLKLKRTAKQGNLKVTVNKGDIEKLKEALAPRTCAGCSHWDRSGEEPSPQLKGDYPDDVEVQHPHRKCLAIVHLYHEGTDRFDSTRPAYLMDASGYRAHLWTLPTFSCPLFGRLLPDEGAMAAKESA